MIEEVESSAKQDSPYALVVDDDPNFLSALAELVEGQGYNVDAVSNLREAEEKLLEGGDYDVALIDVYLPDGDGTKLLERLGGNTEGVIMTGHPNVQNATEALRSGAVDYMTKPLDVGRLKRHLTRICEQYLNRLPKARTNIGSIEEILDSALSEPDSSKILSMLVSDSDRGIVFLGSVYIETNLVLFFERLLPLAASKHSRRSLLSPPGPLSSSPAKAEVAYAARLIDKNLYDALHVFRLIENAAHRLSFDLRKQTRRVRQILGLLSRPRTPKIMMGIHEDQQLRYELGLSVLLICAHLISHCEATLRFVTTDAPLSVTLLELYDQAQVARSGEVE